MPEAFSSGSSTAPADKRSRQNVRAPDPERVLQDIIEASLLHKTEGGTSYFWQICASLLPLTTAPVGFLGNLASIISLADPWRLNCSTDDTVKDAGWVLALNAVALGAGVLANVLLFLNFCKMLPHTFVQSASIALYFSAVIVYMAMFISTEYVYFVDGYCRSQGYWQGANASVLYMVAAIFLFVNLLGHVRRHYNAEHFLDSNERRVYLLSLGLIGWVAVGGAVFQALMDLTYANAVYFCVISFFTLGFGDIVAKTLAPRIVIIPFIYIGVLLIGVTVVSMYTLLHENHVNVGIVHQVRRERLSAYEKACCNDEYDDATCFRTVRVMMRRVRTRNSIISMGLVMGWLLIFWLVGALIYHFTEGWTYFEAFYFVSIVLATVGYGDFTPQTVGGRSFFIIWAFFAIPTMTSSIAYMTDFFSQALDWVVKRIRAKKTQRRTILATLMDFFQNEMFEQYHEQVRTELLEGIVLSLIHEEEGSLGPFEMWQYCMTRLLGPLPHGFWLSERSPLIRPIDERKCLLLIALRCLGMRGRRSTRLLESMLMESNASISDFRRSDEEADISPSTTIGSGVDLELIESQLSLHSKR